MEVQFSNSMNVESYIESIIDLMFEIIYTPIHDRRSDVIMKLVDECDAIKYDVSEASRKMWFKKMDILKHKMAQLCVINDKFIKLCREEKVTNRRWKKTIQENWNQEDIKRLVWKFRKINECRDCDGCEDCNLSYNEDDEITISVSDYDTKFDNGPLSGYVFIQEVLRMYSDAYPDIKELIRTKFESERIINEMISPLIESKEAKKAKMYHSLIKKSKYKYEYIVGADIDAKTKNYEIIFHECIDKVNEGYPSRINEQMSMFVKECPRKTITFSNNEFVFKTNPNVSLKTIIKFYRNLHQ